MIPYLVIYFLILLLFWKVFRTLTRETSEPIHTRKPGEDVLPDCSTHEGENNDRNRLAKGTQEDDTSELKRRVINQPDTNVGSSHGEEENLASNNSIPPNSALNASQSDERTKKAEARLCSSTEPLSEKSLPDEQEIVSKLQNSHALDAKSQATPNGSKVSECLEKAEASVNESQNSINTKVINSDSQETVERFNYDIHMTEPTTDCKHDANCLLTDFEEPEEAKPFTSTFPSDILEKECLPGVIEATTSLNDRKETQSNLCDLEKVEHFANDAITAPLNDNDLIQNKDVNSGDNDEDSRHSKHSHETQKIEKESDEKENTECDAALNENDYEEILASDVTSDDSVKLFQHSGFIDRIDDLTSSEISTSQTTNEQTILKSRQTEHKTVIKKRVTFQDDSIIDSIDDTNSLVDNISLEKSDQSQSIETKSITNISESEKNEEFSGAKCCTTTMLTTSRTEVRKTTLTASQEVSYLVSEENKSEENSGLNANILTSSLSAKGRPIGGVSLFGSNLTSELKLKFQKKKVGSERLESLCGTREEDTLIRTQVEDIPTDAKETPQVQHLFFRNSEIEPIADFEDPIRKSGLLPMTKDRPRPPQRRRPLEGITSQTTSLEET